MTQSVQNKLSGGRRKVFFFFFAGVGVVVVVDQTGKTNGQKRRLTHSSLTQPTQQMAILNFENQGFPPCKRCNPKLLSKEL